MVFCWSAFEKAHPGQSSTDLALETFWSIPLGFLFTLRTDVRESIMLIKVFHELKAWVSPWFVVRLAQTVDQSRLTNRVNQRAWGLPHTHKLPCKVCVHVLLHQSELNVVAKIGVTSNFGILQNTKFGNRGIKQTSQKMVCWIICRVCACCTYMQILQ